MALGGATAAVHHHMGSLHDPSEGPDFALLASLLRDTGEPISMELCDLLFHCHSIAFKEVWASAGAVCECVCASVCVVCASVCVCECV